MNPFLLIPALTIASYALAVWLAVPWLVPLLNTLPAYPFLVTAVASGRLRLAVARMLVWAATLAVCATALAFTRPETTRGLFVNAAAYEQEMMHWIDTGRGRESEPREFLPQHITHAAAFGGLSLASGSLLSMPLGAALMNHMGHYAGTLGARRGSALACVVAWHPWAIVRVVSFVGLGVVLAGPVLCRVRGRPWRWDREARTLVVLAMAGLVLDALLKASLAPMWRHLLTAARWQ